MFYARDLQTVMQNIFSIAFFLYPFASDDLEYI